MRGRPPKLLCFACLGAIGVLFGDQAHVPWEIWMYLVLGSAPLLLFPKYVHPNKMIMAVFLFLMAGWTGFRIQSLPTHHLVQVVGAAQTDMGKRLVRVRGRVGDVSPPSFGIVQSCTLYVDELVDPNTGPRDCCGSLRVYMEGKPVFVTGNRVDVQGWVYPPKNTAHVPNRLNRSRRLSHCGRMFIPESSLVRPINPRDVMDWFHIVRGRMQNLVTNQGVSGIQNEKSRSFIALMLTGVRQESWQSVADPFRRVGVAHLLAISGLHLALLAGGCILLFQCWAGESAWSPSDSPSSCGTPPFSPVAPP